MAIAVHEADIDASLIMESITLVEITNSNRLVKAVQSVRSIVIRSIAAA